MNVRTAEVRRFVVTHDALVYGVRDTVARIDAREVADAFVAALRSRRVEHWSTLASFALARTLPSHDFEPMPGGGTACAVCGAYARLDAFESDAFATLRAAGAIRADSLRYALFDLEAFARESVTEPSDADRTFFDRAIARIAALEPDGDAFAAERASSAAFDSRVDRKRFLATLGICGVLASPDRPGFSTGFVRFADRARLDATPYAYPVRWWRRDCGLSRDALHGAGLDRFLTTRTVASCVAGHAITGRRRTSR